MEHLIVLGGQNYLPFARKQIKLMRKQGAQRASKTFEVDGVRISLKIEPGHEHIRIEELKPARLVWVPEGFFFTPRTETATTGYGLPATEDGFGTPGGPLRFVMVNHWRNNNYPDFLRSAWFKLTKGEDAGEKKGKYRRNILTWPLFYTDKDAAELLDVPEDAPPGTKPKKNLSRVGLTVRGTVLPQFDGWLLPKIEEVREPSVWYCHRPEVVPRYRSSIGAEVLRLTNEVRVAEGMRPCIPPVRGFTTDLAQIIRSIVKQTTVLRHDSSKFPEGYRSTVARAYYRAGDVAGENLAIVTPEDVEDSTKPLPNFLVDSWVDSPRHFEVMTFDYETPFEPAGGADLVDELDPGSVACVLDIASGQGTVTETHAPGSFDEGSPSREVNPPVSGTLAVQMFTPLSHPLVGVSVVQTAYGPISFGGTARKTDSSSMDCYRPIKPPRRYSSDAEDERNQAFVYFKGRRLFYEYPGGTKLPADIDSVECIGLTVIHKKNEDGEDVAWLRMLLKHRENESGGLGYVLLVEGRFNAFYETRETLARFDFPVDADKYSVGRFSASGNKAVFPFTALAPYTGTVVRQGSTDWSSRTAQNPSLARELTFGQVVNFVEINADGSHTITTDSLDVEVPTCSGTANNHQFLSTCVGSCKLFATYSGEELQFAEITVDCETSKSNDDPWQIRLRGELKFPNDDVLVYTDTFSDTDWFQTTGDATIIHYLDIDNPDHTIYEKMRFGPMGDEVAPTPSPVMRVRAWLMLGVADPVEMPLVSLDVDDLTPGYETWAEYRPAFWVERAGEIPLLTPFRGFINLLLTHSSCQNSHPTGAYKAVVAQDDQTRGLGAKLEYMENSALVNPFWVGPVHQAHVGPVIDFDRSLSSTRFVRVVAWDDELIVCGGFRFHFSSFDAAPVELGDDRYFLHSTLDLGEITGLGVLLKDISPIGAL